MNARNMSFGPLDSTNREETLDIAIIGTGFSGLGMAIRLRQTGNQDFAVFEKASSVGGTWRDNHYPGCACDVQSHVYSFSFAPNPRWTRMFAPQPEIRAYMEDCVQRFNVGSHLRFDHELVNATYDETAHRWHLTFANGKRVCARVLVSGMGGLSRAAYPNIPGIETFKGEAFHSQHWKHDYALEGKRVAVIGTGADLVYPACHHALAHEIAERGALVAEWPRGTPARSAHFPQRNRLIAALSGGVLIVEAALRSGSLITARLANEMGRDVFAIPGSIHAPLSQGCHALIRDGAKLVETAADVLDEFGLDPARPVNSKRGAPAAASADADLDDDTRRLLDAIGYGPVPLELLAQRTSLPSGTLHRLLLQLELAGRVAALPGGRYTRIDGAQAEPAQARGTSAVLHSGA